jgi:hypothetical protein
LTFEIPIYVTDDEQGIAWTTISYLEQTGWADFPPLAPEGSVDVTLAGANDLLITYP